MRSLREGVMSATMQVKVSSPEIILVAAGRFIAWKPASERALKVSASLASRGLSPWRANVRSILELGRTEAFRMEAAKELKE